MNPSSRVQQSLTEQLRQIFRNGAPSLQAGEQPYLGEDGARRPDQELAQRLVELGALQPNWDGYGATTPTPRAVSVTKEILAAIGAVVPRVLDDLFLAPSTDGGMRLEWVKDAGRELTAIIPPDDTGMVEFYRSNERRGFEEDIWSNDLAELPKMLDWLMSGQAG